MCAYVFIFVFNHLTRAWLTEHPFLWSFTSTAAIPLAYSNISIGELK